MLIHESNQHLIGINKNILPTIVQWIPQRTVWLMQLFRQQNTSLHNLKSPKIFHKTNCKMMFVGKLSLDKHLSLSFILCFIAFKSNKQLTRRCSYSLLFSFGSHLTMQTNCTSLSNATANKILNTLNAWLFWIHLVSLCIQLIISVFIQLQMDKVTQLVCVITSDSTTVLLLHARYSRHAKYVGNNSVPNSNVQL